MGIYLNPGNAMFQESLNSMIYVDKSGLIEYTNSFLNTKQKLVCVSRPRRFGKSMALEMLAAYYSRGCDSEQMFSGLKIGYTEDGSKATLENLNSYDVLFVDMQGLIGDVLYEPGMDEKLEEFSGRVSRMNYEDVKKLQHPLLTEVQRQLIRDIRSCNGYAEYISKDEESLGSALLSVYQQTGNQFILLIDEWDSVFRNYETDTLLQDKYIDFLRGLFKNARMLPVCALVYMTGILPIKRYGTQSALNNFTEYTFLRPMKLAEFSGFTEEEVRKLCTQYEISFEEMSVWYNGYSFKNAGRIYNPRSVVSAIENEEFGNYWTETGTYESVKKPIEMNFEGLKEDIITMLGNGRCKVNVTRFQNDMVTFNSRDDVLTFLIHLGYLGYDSVKKEVYIPNKEIRDEFVNAIEGSKWTRTFEAISDSAELLEATLAGDEEKVAKRIEKVHEGNTSILNYNNENALSCVIQIAYYQAQDEYMLIREMPAGKGFADVVFLPRHGVGKPAIVVELKWNQSAETALNQIREKHYGNSVQEYNSSLSDYCGEILLVGIAYDKGTKRHICRIERTERNGKK